MLACSALWYDLARARSVVNRCKDILLLTFPVRSCHVRADRLSYVYEAVLWNKFRFVCVIKFPHL